MPLFNFLFLFAGTGGTGGCNDDEEVVVFAAVDEDDDGVGVGFCGEPVAGIGAESAGCVALQGCKAKARVTVALDHDADHAVAEIAEAVEEDDGGLRVHLKLSSAPSALEVVDHAQREDPR